MFAANVFLEKMIFNKKQQKFIKNSSSGDVAGMTGEDIGKLQELGEDGNKFRKNKKRTQKA